MVRTVEQRGVSRKPSRFFAIRLNEEDQKSVEAIIRAGLAENITDAIRCALFLGARAAQRVIKKRSDA